MQQTVERTVNGGGQDTRHQQYVKDVYEEPKKEDRTTDILKRAICIVAALIVLLGNTPARWILQTSEGITKLRGRWFEWRGAAVMPMFHPSYLLRNASSKEGSPKHLTWLDIQEVKRQWDAVKATGSISGIKFG